MRSSPSCSPGDASRWNERHRIERSRVRSRRPRPVSQEARRRLTVRLGVRRASANPDRTARRSVTRRIPTIWSVTESIATEPSTPARRMRRRRRRRRRPHAQPRPPSAEVRRERASPNVGCDARDRDLEQRVDGRDRGVPRLARRPADHASSTASGTSARTHTRRHSADDRAVSRRARRRRGRRARGMGRMLLDAFVRLPAIGFLAADLEDDPHDEASYVRHHVRPARVHGGRGERRPAAARPDRRRLRDDVTRAQRARRRVPPEQEAGLLARGSGLHRGHRATRLRRRRSRGPSWSITRADPHYTGVEGEETYWGATSGASDEGAGQAGAVPDPLRPAPQRAVRVVPAPA